MKWNNKSKYEIGSSLSVAGNKYLSRYILFLYFIVLGVIIALDG